MHVNTRCINSTRSTSSNIRKRGCISGGVYVPLTRMPGESYRSQLRSLLYFCYIFWVQINSLVCRFFLCIVQIRLLQFSSHGHSKLCNSTNAESPKYWCTPHSQNSTPSKLHTSLTATPLAPNFLMNKIQNCLHVLSFWAATPLQSFPVSPLFVRHTHAQNPSLQLQNSWPLHFLTLWPPHLEQSPPSGTVLLSLPSKANSFLFSEHISICNTVLHP